MIEAFTKAANKSLEVVGKTLKSVRKAAYEGALYSMTDPNRPVAAFVVGAAITACAVYSTSKGNYAQAGLFALYATSAFSNLGRYFKDETEISSSTIADESNSALAGVALLSAASAGMQIYTDMSDVMNQVFPAVGNLLIAGLFGLVLKKKFQQSAIIEDNAEDKKIAVQNLASAVSQIAQQRDVPFKSELN